MEYNVKFNEKGLIPVIVTDYDDNKVLMMAWMNKEALDMTIKTKKAHYFSRSRQALWMKGESSGNIQEVVSVKKDCDSDTLLMQVKQTGVACHTGNDTCFYTDLLSEPDQGKTNNQESELYGATILKELYNVVINRKDNPKEGSYTNYLFDKGIDKILKKVGEEASEVIIAAKNDSRDEIRYETADLLYHLIVMLVDRGLTLEEIYGELKSRR